MSRTPYWVLDINCMMCGRDYTIQGRRVRAMVSHLDQKINIPARCSSCGGAYQLVDVTERSIFTESVDWRPSRGRPSDRLIQERLRNVGPSFD